ncbi:MAG TPA: diaminopimelate decarboxylase [Vicingaceae bacterium]|nr:diaminopimelate decarboxylase [Vicingaceae bacterium]
MSFTVSEINRFKELKTPFYYYQLSSLEENLQMLTNEANKYGYHVHYALKANANLPILEKIKTYGLGADCVSGNEILKAKECGFSPQKIVFAGVGKSDEEINISLDNDIFCLNCESIPEIEVINELAKQKNKTAAIALRINPNVNAKTHHYITTGLEENKFGINLWELEEVLKTLEVSKNIKLIGLHFHIGSQITDLSVFKGLCLRVNEIQEWFYNHHIIVDHINVGGGLGINYENPEINTIPDYKTFFKLFNDILKLRPNQHLHFELGRAIVAQCGSLISKVLYVKKGIKTNFAIIDAGMTELIRPALYQATHKISNLTTNSKTICRYDVVGPICESSDCFAKALDLPETQRGDLLSIHSAGAYGEVMASSYNLRDIVKSYYSEE